MRNFVWLIKNQRHSYNRSNYPGVLNQLQVRACKRINQNNLIFDIEGLYFPLMPKSIPFSSTILQVYLQMGPWEQDSRGAGQWDKALIL